MRSWKSTLAGIFVGFLNLSQNGVSVKTILLSAAFAALGSVAKDFNVSGKTNPPSKDDATK
jgi:hypothetical protein